MSKHKNGLIFMFRENQNNTKCEIFEEVILDNNYQPNELYEKYGGVVVSHWLFNKKILKVPIVMNDLVKLVYGQRGFGNRKSTKCVGSNTYQGNKATKASVGNPL